MTAQENIYTMIIIGFIFLFPALYFVRAKRRNLLIFIGILIISFTFVATSFDLVFNVVGGTTLASLAPRMPNLYTTNAEFGTILSLEKMGQWGDFLGGHFNVFAFLVLSITVYLQYESNIAQKASNAMDRIERLYKIVDELLKENDDLHTTVKYILEATSVDNRRARLQTISKKDLDSLERLKLIYSLIKKEIDMIGDPITQEHENEKFSILKITFLKELEEALVLAEEALETSKILKH